MGLLNRFKLYDRDKEWAVTVIPLKGKDGYRLIGTGRLKHIQKEVNSVGLDEFIKTFGLIREQELGQMDIFEII